MSNVIQLLPDHVANQIAAGEVVQRPASVVKELLENAVDAGATDIKLIVKDAGKSLIQVIDNGVGMNVTDARLCFERHATSKIRHAEDLFAIHTKGFRGEALASIAAIAHVEMKTRQDQQELGTHIIIEGSKIVSQEPAVTPKGTSFAIKNLFFNIPARRNFLKSETVEMRHVIDEFQRVALAHPNIHFTLIHNGAEVYQLPGSNLRQRIVNLFAGKTNEKLVPVSEQTDIVTINGFILKPEYAKKTRGEQFFFVNHRFIKSGYLHHAIMAAYEGLLKDGMHPGYFLYLEVPPHSIDINIHPTKTEIKFDDEHALYAILRSAVKHSLGQFQVAPVLDFEHDPNLDTPYHLKNETAPFPTIQVDSDFNPFTSEFKDTQVKRSSSFSSSRMPTMEMPSWESLYVGLKQEELPSEQIWETETQESKLFEEKSAETVTSAVWQVHKKYLMTQIKSGLMVVDQQRAHQRILYEQYLTFITMQQGASQQLLFPLELFFTPQEISMLRDIKDSLINMGFVFTRWAEDHVTVEGIPVQMTESQVIIVFEDLMQQMENGMHQNDFSYNDAIAKSMAKSLAVRTGTALTEKEQEHLINSLFACKEPGTSPFLKPTFITLPLEELDKKFSL
ncbi:MAG: DNA mismatch repair endonuclease MutL [Flavobacterium sp.]